MSLTESEEYQQKKAHYQNHEVATAYDEVRWSTTGRRRSNKRKLRAIERAIDAAASAGRPIRTALDIPCGTGRIFSLLSTKQIFITGADLSQEMIQVAQSKFKHSPYIKEYVQCNAEDMFLPDNQFDAVFCIRFLFHLPENSRHKALKEMSRVSREWVIVDYRHRYTLKFLLKRLLLKSGLSSKRYERMSRSEIEKDFSKAGLHIVRIFPTFRLFSDKWVILGRKIK